MRVKLGQRWRNHSTPAQSDTRANMLGGGRGRILEVSERPQTFKLLNPQSLYKDPL